MTAPAAAPARAERPEVWTYASGRVAALEGLLLGFEALERLAEAESPAAAAGALAESPLRGRVAEARTPAAVAGAVAGYYSQALESLKSDCPFAQMFELTALARRFGALKERVRAFLTEAKGAEAGPDETRELLGDFGEEGEAARGLELLFAALAGVDGPEPGLLLDLALDSARLLEALRLAGALGDAAVLGHVEGEVGVRAALLVWRSRLVVGNDEEAPLRRWLPRLLLREELGKGLPARLWSADFAAWPELLAEELALGLAGEVFGAGKEGNLIRWEKAAFDWLTVRAGELRGQAFGVGRVYAYAWALAVEERNVRLALVGRLRGVEPAAIKALLWESCA